MHDCREEAAWETRGAADAAPCHGLLSNGKPTSCYGASLPSACPPHGPACVVADSILLGPAVQGLHTLGIGNSLMSVQLSTFCLVGCDSHGLGAPKPPSFLHITRSFPPCQGFGPCGSSRFHLGVLWESSHSPELQQGKHTKLPPHKTHMSEWPSPILCKWRK